MISRDQFVRSVFRTALKNTNTRKLARRFWPAMRVNIEGHTFDLHPADNTTELRLYLNEAFDEPESLSLMRKLVTGKRTLIFDIGANCGMYSIPMMNSAASGSQLLAFEPSPVMAERLRINARLNNLSEASFHIHQVALASSAGTALLNVHPRNHGQSSLEELKKTLHTVEVQQRPLLDFLPDQSGFEQFVIKIDVESREDDVLRPFLQHADPAALPDAILVEVEHEAQWPMDLRALLIEKGYRAGFEEEGNALFSR